MFRPRQPCHQHLATCWAKLSIGWMFCLYMGSSHIVSMYTMFQKKYTWFLIITVASVDRFPKFFHNHIPTEILYTLSRFSTSPYICSYTILWNLKIAIAANFNGILHVKRQKSHCRIWGHLNGSAQKRICGTSKLKKWMIDV